MCNTPRRAVTVPTHACCANSPGMAHCRRAVQTWWAQQRGICREQCDAVRACARIRGEARGAAARTSSPVVFAASARTAASPKSSTEATMGKASMVWMRSLRPVSRSAIAQAANNSEGTRLVHRGGDRDGRRQLDVAITRRYGCGAHIPVGCWMRCVVRDVEATHSLEPRGANAALHPRRRETPSRSRPASARSGLRIVLCDCLTPTPQVLLRVAWRMLRRPHTQGAGTAR